MLVSPSDICDPAEVVSHATGYSLRRDVGYSTLHFTEPGSH